MTINVFLFLLSLVCRIPSKTSLVVWILLVFFATHNFFLSPSFMPNTFARYISLVHTCFLSQLEIHHSKPSLLVNFWLRNMLLLPHPCLLWGLLFLSCIFLYTFFGLCLVFAVANLSRNCIWFMGMHLKALKTQASGHSWEWFFLIRLFEAGKPSLNVCYVFWWQPR